jgi:hypothetical protein
MPAATFAALILCVIAAAGLSLAVLWYFGASVQGAALAALLLAALVRGFAWR